MHNSLTVFSANSRCHSERYGVVWAITRNFGAGEMPAVLSMLDNWIGFLARNFGHMGMGNQKKIKGSFFGLLIDWKTKSFVPMSVLHSI